MVCSDWGQRTHQKTPEKASKGELTSGACTRETSSNHAFVSIFAGFWASCEWKGVEMEFQHVFSARIVRTLAYMPKKVLEGVAHPLKYHSSCSFL